MTQRIHIPETGWTGVRVGDLQLAVFDEGTGPVVLLQHGYPDTPHTWDDVAAHLVERGFRVIRPFGRGIAPSDIPAGDAFHIRDQAADVVGILDALDIETASLVGHDWGATAVWGAGHLAPERIHKLVAVAIPHPAAIRMTPRLLWGSRHFIANRLPGAARRYARNDYAHVRHMYERWSPGFDWPDAEFEAVKNAYAAPGCFHAALGYYRRLDRWPFRGPVACDTLVIGGLTDGVLKPAHFEASTRRVSGSCTVRMLPGGHFLHREHPEPFIETLTAFLQDST